MGLILCSQHGQQGIINVCSHIHEKSKKKNCLKSSKRLMISDSDIPIYFCALCIEKYKLSDIKQMDFDALIKVEDELYPACGKCIIV